MNKLQMTIINEKVSTILMNSGVGVLPTDTVYGLVARVANIDSVAKLYKLKSRDKKPGTIIASSIQQLLDLGIEKHYLDIAKCYWPNPVSVIIPVAESLMYLHQGVGSLAFRVVADKELAKLLDITGPLLTSSANNPGQPVSNTIIEARKYFGNNVDFYIDGGNLSAKSPSTIIRIINDDIEIIRQGSVRIDYTK